MGIVIFLNKKAIIYPIYTLYIQEYKKGKSMQSFFNTKFAALNQANYRPMNLNPDKMTNEGFVMAVYANTQDYNVTGADFGIGTHGYVNAREQAILNNGEAI